VIGPLPLSWLPSIGGLVCDFIGGGSEGGHHSAWPSESPDMGITRFPDGTWLVMLPGYGGSGQTLPDALREAKEGQHGWLQAHREQAIADATREHYEARRRRLFADGPCRDCGSECGFGGCRVADAEHDDPRDRAPGEWR
jgi:hypothetical protein